MNKRLFVKMITILLLGILVACNETEDVSNEEELIAPVETEQVTQKDIVIEKTVYGRLLPSKITPVITPMMGEVDSLEVENGDQVEEDDIIAKILTPAGKQEIKAPEDGEIMNLEIDEGDLTPEEEPLAMIVNLDSLTIEFSVTDRLRSLFALDETYQAEANGDTYEAIINSVDSLPNDSGLYTVEATVENKDQQLLPGMIMKLILPETKIKNTLTLPSEAIIEDSEGTYVYRIEDGKAVKTEIVIIEAQTDQTAFEGDMEEGDEVIINGQLTISDGHEVEVVEGENQS